MRHAVRSAISLFVLLFAIPSFAAITGTVMNADGGAISGAKISIYAPETLDARRARIASSTPQKKALATATSDANGAFRIDVPKEQRFVELRVDAAGYAPDTTWSPAEDEAGAVVLTKAPVKTGTITGNGKPVANATVAWFGGTSTELIAVTDEKGRYSVPDPGKWAQRVVVLHPDFAPLNDFMIREARTSPDRTLQPGVKITGKITNEDGTPAAGAELFVDNWPVGKTADDGTFTVAHARKDWSELQASLGSRVARRPHTDAAVALKLSKGATLAGTVVDAKTRQPVADVIIMMLPGGFGMPGGEAMHSAITDAKGNYSIANVVSGNFQLFPDRPGYSVPRVEVALPAGRSVQKPLYGTPLATVSGTVVDEEKRPVAAARISTRAGSREGMTMVFGRFTAQRGAFSGPDGRFVARNVNEGDVIVDANKKGYPPAKSSTFRVASGEKKTGVILTIPRGIAFSGRVLDKNNKPVSGAAVEITETQNNDPFGAMRRVMVFGSAATTWCAPRATAHSRSGRRKGATTSA
jgi:hypothetical protein